MNKTRTTPGKMMLLPPHPDACQVCARKHEPNLPHDAQSLYWAFAANMKGEPKPTWSIAMAHCTPEMKKLWTAELTRRGVDLGGK